MRFPGFVYFVDGQGLIKIGYASNPDSRLRAHQVGSPIKLSYLLVVEGSRADEGALHKRLLRFKSHGEWFMDNHFVREEMASLKKSRPLWLGRMMTPEVGNALPSLPKRFADLSSFSPN